MRVVTKRIHDGVSYNGDTYPQWAVSINDGPELCVVTYLNESDALAHAEVIRKALAWRPTEAICFKCRPSAFGITTAPSEPAPTCAACGAPCTGGGWVEVKR